jgi:hypothetical protein
MDAPDPTQRFGLATVERAKVTQVTAHPVHPRLFADTSMPSLP